MSDADSARASATAADPARVAQRRAALQRSGVTQAVVAARAGVSRQSVGLVLAGHHRSRHVEQAIADACGLERELMFPDAAAAPGMAARHAGPPAPRPSESATAAQSDARAGVAEVVVGASVPGAEVEARVTAELRAIAERVLLAIAGEGLAADRPVVRAVAAALRELGGPPSR